MSRSLKKQAWLSWCNSTRQKEFRKQEHKAERKLIKQKLVTTLDDLLLPCPKVYGNEWASPRDGKVYIGNDKNKECNCNINQTNKHCFCKFAYLEYMRK